MTRITSLLSLLVPILSVVVDVTAAICPVFDSNFNLYVFGAPGGDYLVGPQSAWSGSVTTTTLPSAGRPPFDGTGPLRCYLAQFFNAIYILGASNADPLALYIFDVGNKTWSLQAVQAGGLDPTNTVEILDHDTNVFYALSAGNIYFLNLNAQTAAISTPIAWNLQKSPSFTTTGYKPTMAIAQNHIHFFGVPGAPAGELFIYVIHFAFSQPTPQTYPSTTSQATFPNAHGQAPSIFRATTVQEVIAFIPDDSSATYFVNVQTNTTTPFAGPTDKSSSIFSASESAVVQLTSAGKLFFLPLNDAATAPAAGAAWTPIGVTIPTAGTTSPTTTASGSSATPGGSTSGGTSSSNGTTTGSSSTASGKTGAAQSLTIGFAQVLGFTLLAAVALPFY